MYKSHQQQVLESADFFDRLEAAGNRYITVKTSFGTKTTRIPNPQRKRINARQSHFSSIGIKTDD